MTSLESLLQPIAGMINRQISAKTPARELCAQLADRVMAVRVKDTALAVYLIVTDDVVVMSADHDQDPDVIVEGTLLALARLAGPEGQAAIRQGEIALSGDALVAQQFQKLLYYGQPDIEEELSGVVGDAAAHGIAEVFRSVTRWGKGAQETMRQNVGEYLQEESRAVPTRDEITTFRDKVNVLRDDVARLEARLQKVETLHNAGDQS